MKRLVEAIAQRDGEEPVLLRDDTVFSVQAILSQVESVRASGLVPLSQPFRVTDQDDLNFILGLLAADGWASEILLGGKEGEAERPVVESSAIGKSESIEELPCDTQWLLATSGTTGTPKWVRHSLASLSRATKTDSTAGASIRWGLLYEPRRFAGLQVVLQALLGGSSLVIPSDRNDFRATVSEFRRHGVNALSATPSYWRKLLLAGLADQLDLRIVTLGGEIADGALLQTLRRLFPQAKIIHIYASTEAGVGFAVRDGREGFPDTFLQHPPQGIELKIDEQGQLLVRSKWSPQSYVDGSPLIDGEGWVNTGDLVEKRGNRYCFLGRASGVINVGGDKVHPQEIEDVARAVPGVGLALARAKQNPIVGQVPELLIEAEKEANPDLLRDAVLERCRAELPRHKWPAVVKVVDELPLSGAGKVERR